MVEKINIKKISSASLPAEATDFCPVECLDCENNGNISQAFFRVKPYIDNEHQEKLVSKYLDSRFGFKKFSVLFSDKGMIITSSKCPECDSENIVLDIL